MTKFKVGDIVCGYVGGQQQETHMLIEKVTADAFFDGGHAYDVMFLETGEHWAFERAIFEKTCRLVA